MSQALQGNGYPKGFIQKYTCPQPDKRTPRDQVPHESVTLPYISGLFKCICRVLAPLAILVTFRPFRTQRQELVHPKDPVPANSRKGGVYSIPCAECPRTYMGQTGRSLDHRLREHRRALKNYAKELHFLHLLYSCHSLEHYIPLLFSQSSTLVFCHFALFPISSIHHSTPVGCTAVLPHFPPSSPGYRRVVLPPTVLYLTVHYHRMFPCFYYHPVYKYAKQSRPCCLTILVLPSLHSCVSGKEEVASSSPSLEALFVVIPTSYCDVVISRKKQDQPLLLRRRRR